MTSDQVAALLRGGMPALALGVLGDLVPGPDPVVRVELTFAQMMGVAVLRYVVRLEPLASLPAEELARTTRPGPAAPPARLAQRSPRPRS